MIRGSYLARRISSSRLLLGNVMLTVLITAALGAALASFAARALPQGVRSQLARSPALSITVSGAMNASQAAAGSRVVRASLGTALAGVPYQLDRALWSDLLGLATPRGSKTTPLVQAAAPAQITEHAALTAGTWPGQPRPGQPIPVALPVLAAGQLHVTTGTILEPRDGTTNALVRLRVTGLYRLRNPADRYWGIDLIAPSGISIQQPFVSYGPAVVSPAAFGPGGLAVGQVSWVVLPDAAGIGLGDLAGLAAKVSRATAFLQQSDSLGGLTVSTGMAPLLGRLASNLVVARSLLVIGALELALLAAAALALAARLLAVHREEEAALLSARGATRWQLARPTLAETLLFGTVAAVAGVYLGTRLAGLLLRAAPPGAGSGVAGIPAAAWSAALAVLALCAAVMLWPSVRPAAPGVARIRQGRQATLAGVARAGADLALLALALLALQELRTYSAVAHPAAGGISIDPVIAVAPVLVLAAVALIPLRLLPVLAAAIDRAAARGKRLAAALASWQISRRPIRQSGPLLLVVLAIAALTLALGQYQTSRRSAADQAAFAAGADLRADLPVPVPLATAGAIGRAPGILDAMPVTSQSTGSGGEVLAVDARTAAATVLLRGDLSPYPARQLWQRIIPSGPAPGLAIPGRPARLEIVARLAAGSAAARPGAAAVAVSIQDADGIVYLIDAGSLLADGRTRALVADLSAARQAAYPLRLLGLSFTYELPPFGFFLSAPPAELSITGLAVQAAARGRFATPFAAGSALASWAAAASAPGIGIAGAPPNVGAAKIYGSPPDQMSWKSAGRSQQLAFLPGYLPQAGTAAAAGVPDVGDGELTIAARAPSGALPGIATSAFLRASHSRVGATVPAPVGGVTIPVRIVAAVRAFPTVTGGGGAVVVDQASAQAILASRSALPMPVTQWWLTTTRRSLPPVLRGASVTSSAAEATALLGNPLSAAPQQAALAIGIAAALLAAIGFSFSVAASVRARRTENALLSALGVTRYAQAGQLCLEQLMLTVPAAAAGMLAGVGLAWLLLPAVTLTAGAASPFPPVLVEIPVGWAAALAAVVAALPVLAAAVSVARRPDPAVELRAAEAS
jgi:hypothetical protein